MAKSFWSEKIQRGKVYDFVEVYFTPVKPKPTYSDLKYQAFSVQKSEGHCPRLNRV